MCVIHNKTNTFAIKACGEVLEIQSGPLIVTQKRKSSLPPEMQSL